MTSQWEYEVISFSMAHGGEQVFSIEAIKNIQEHGQKGWELVSVTSRLVRLTDDPVLEAGTEYTLWFKRQIPEEEQTSEDQLAAGSVG